jgi:plasmid stabilization system protein ParE
MKVDFSDEAIIILEEIHENLRVFRDLKFADGVVDKIFDKTQLLVEFPEMGTIEQSKAYKALKVRYLIEGFYKIFYQIDAKRGIIEVISVFDTRQNPSKMLSKKE